MMSRILLENQYPRDSEDKLLRAFRTLDPDNKGYIEADKLRNLLTTHGERFSQEEIDDFLTFASDAESGRMHKASDSKVLAAPQRTTPSLLGLTHQAPAWPGSLDGGRGAGLIA
jgi:hypothetical protein